MSRPARLAVGVISAGRVGSVLGAALDRAGHPVVAASGISTESVRRAEALLPEVPLLPADEVARRADLVLLAVPDDELAQVVSGLVDTGALRTGQIVVHTSGAHGVGVLRQAAEHGVLPVALHPVMTFNGRLEDLDRLGTSCVGVTARPDDEAAAHVGAALTVEMGAEPVQVPEEARSLYHTALAHGANHLVTLVADCAELLRGGGVDNAERLLGPLLSAALDNALRRGDQALTGPVARGDTGTVRDHLDVLAKRRPELTCSYSELARRTVARAGANGMLTYNTVVEFNGLLDEVGGAQ